MGDKPTVLEIKDRLRRTKLHAQFVAHENALGRSVPSTPADEQRKEFEFPSFLTRFRCLRFLELTIQMSRLKDLPNLLNLLQVTPFLQQLRIYLDRDSAPWPVAWLQGKLMPHAPKDLQNAYAAHSHLKKLDIITPIFGENVVDFMLTLVRCAHVRLDLKP